jgi:hypothetical protein
MTPTTSPETLLNRTKSRINVTSICMYTLSTRNKSFMTLASILSFITFLTFITFTFALKNRRNTFKQHRLHNTTYSKRAYAVVFYIVSYMMLQLLNLRKHATTVHLRITFICKQRCAVQSKKTFTK